MIGSRRAEVVANDPALLKHLAEKVMGAKFDRIVGGLEYFSFPTDDGRSAKLVFSLDGWWMMANQPAVWNPPKNTNHALDVLEAATNKYSYSYGIFGVPSHSSAMRGATVLLLKSVRPPNYNEPLMSVRGNDFSGSFQENFCRAICMPVAQATGYQEGE